MGATNLDVRKDFEELRWMEKKLKLRNVLQKKAADSLRETYQEGKLQAIAAAKDQEFESVHRQRMLLERQKKAAANLNGNVGKQKGGKKSKRWTTIPVMALSGECVICVIIIEGTVRNLFVETGIDVIKMADEDDIDDVGSVEFIEENLGASKLVPGGSSCCFNGKTIPCMVRYSEKGGINEAILTNIFRTLDELEVFKKERDEKGLTPFILLDGHHSCFTTEFLSYVTDPKHPWKVSIGVPYATSKWQ
eukprot:14963249-Ditylum_brightwellii.AAC.1